MISLVIQDKVKIIILRFVYYETLVTSMKSLGVREPVISYDDLKVQRLSCFMTLACCKVSKSANKYKQQKPVLWASHLPVAKFICHHSTLFQAECVRKRLYGYVESANLLAKSGKHQNNQNQ